MKRCLNFSLQSLTKKKIMEDIKIRVVCLEVSLTYLVFQLTEKKLSLKPVRCDGCKEVVRQVILLSIFKDRFILFLNIYRMIIINIQTNKIYNAKVYTRV